jgi:hypothetical protein
VIFAGKILVLTFNDTKEKAVEKAVAAPADIIPLEALQPPQSPAPVFPGLEIGLHHFLRQKPRCFFNFVEKF